MRIHTPERQFTANDYANVATMSGAVKLADSQVAPLLAQARGYFTIDDDAGAKAFVKTQLVVSETQTSRRISTMTRQGNDVLVIPWFNMADVIRIGTAAVSPLTQLRPSMPLANGKGKPAKYEFLSGSVTSIDIHPGVPAEWMESAPTILITEGVIKADSALTAQLRSAGVSIEDLLAVEDRAAALARVQELALQVPVSRRVPILAIAGVANWRQNPEWAQIRLTDRTIQVAFDGDVHQNPQVHRQAQSLWMFLESKKAFPRLVDLGGVEAEKQKAAAGLPADAKLGLDDYLAHVGSWESLPMLTEAHLPAEPDGADDAETSIAEAFAAKGASRARFVASGDPANVIAIIDGAHTGLYRQLADGVSARLTSWVPRRAAKAQRVSLDRLGAPVVDTANDLVRIEILTAAGEIGTTPDIPMAEAEDIGRLLRLVDLEGANLPASPSDDRAVRDAIRNLGKGEVGAAAQYMTTGWLRRDDGTHVLLLPAGSVDHSGSAAERANGIEGDTARAMGFPQIASSTAELVAGADALGRLIDLHLDAMVALVGGILQAVIPSSDGHAAVMLVAPPGVGKSLVLSAPQATVSGVPVGARRFALAFPRATAYSAAGIAELMRNWVVFADDYRTRGVTSASTLDGIRKRLTALLQVVYGQGERSAGRADQSIYVGRHVETSALLTGEERPTDDATLQRVLVLEMSAQQDPDSYLRWGATSSDAARRLIGWYVSRVAKWLDRKGIEGVQREAAELRATLSRELGGTDRPAELAAHLALGWQKLLEWLPDEARAALTGELDEDQTSEDIYLQPLRELVASNRRDHSTGSVAARLVEQIAETIASGRGHLVATGSALIPRIAGITPDRLGYVRDLRDDGQGWISRQNPVGAISADGRYVVILNAALKAAARDIGFGGSDLAGVLKPMAVTGTGPLDRAPRSLGLNRERGLVVEAEALGLDPHN